jgi:hypothetical protein
MSSAPTTLDNNSLADNCLQAVDGAAGRQLQAAHVDGCSIAAGELLGSRRAFDGLGRVTRPGAGGLPVYELRLAC